jgi:hypothetical protein
MTHLIVPIRDRRTSRRIVTLKNSGRIAIAFAIVFVGLTIRSEMRKNDAAGYGRLFGKQVGRQEEIAKPKYDVVKEAPVADHTAADPLLMEPAARAQQLGIGLDPIAPPTTTVAAADASADGFGQPKTPVVQSSTGSGVTIVGDGANGVTIVRGGDQRRPALSGGIFKQ